MEPVAGRACGACALCCKVMKIAEIDKPWGRWCDHCQPGKGCAIYQERPGECRSFMCGWLTNPDFDEAWFPPRAKMVVTLEGDGQMVAVHVDAAQPGAWRRKPFHDKLKSWARLAEKRDALVLVRVGARALVIFPDGEVELGAMREGDRIGVRRDASGLRREAFRIPAAEDGLRSPSD